MYGNAAIVLIVIAAVYAVICQNRNISRIIRYANVDPIALAKRSDGTSEGMREVVELILQGMHQRSLLLAYRTERALERLEEADMPEDFLDEVAQLLKSFWELEARTDFGHRSFGLTLPDIFFTGQPPLLHNYQNVRKEWREFCEINELVRPIAERHLSDVRTI